LQQVGLLEEKYLSGEGHKQIFSVSTQHYSFAVSAFVDIIRQFGNKNYDFTLRETQTYEIIQDVSQFRSEVGILYLSSKIIEQSGLRFDELFTAKPHVFISSKHPLAKKRKITPQQLEEYPFLSFEQGSYNSFYFSEEIMSRVNRSMTIKVRDRATLFNLLVGLNGYTICTGIISTELNGENIISHPLAVDEYIRVGTVTRRGVNLTRLGEEYIKALHAHV
jgi:DNA-binding transcriptional LysR family regulator